MFTAFFVAALSFFCCVQFRLQCVRVASGAGETPGRQPHPLERGDHRDLDGARGLASMSEPHESFHRGQGALPKQPVRVHSQRRTSAAFFGVQDCLSALIEKIPTTTSSSKASGIT